jgi:hypothetical protein
MIEQAIPPIHLQARTTAACDGLLTRLFPRLRSKLIRPNVTSCAGATAPAMKDLP